MNNKSGVSVIILILSVVVLAILVTVIVNVTVNNDMINQSSEAIFKNDMYLYNEVFEVYKNNKTVELTIQGLSVTTLNYDIWEYGDVTGTIKEILPDIKDEHALYLKVVEGELIWTGESTEAEKVIFADLGIKYNN